MDKNILDTPFTVDFVLEKLKSATDRYKNCSIDLLDEYESKVSSNIIS